MTGASSATANAASSSADWRGPAEPAQCLELIQRDQHLGLVVRIDVAPVAVGQPRIQGKSRPRLLGIGMGLQRQRLVRRQHLQQVWQSRAEPRRQPWRPASPPGRPRWHPYSELTARHLRRRGRMRPEPQLGLGLRRSASGRPCSAANAVRDPHA